MSFVNLEKISPKTARKVSEHFWFVVVVGVVYKAIDLNTNKHVALKKIRVEIEDEGAKHLLSFLLSDSIYPMQPSARQRMADDFCLVCLYFLVILLCLITSASTIFDL